MQATARGHEPLRDEPADGRRRAARGGPGLDRGLQEASVKATLPVFFPAGDDQPWGWQDAAEWQRYADWMRDNGLIKQPQNAERVLTNEFLPGRGWTRRPVEQD